MAVHCSVSPASPIPPHETYSVVATMSNTAAEERESSSEQLRKEEAAPSFASSCLPSFIVPGKRSEGREGGEGPG